MPGCQSRQVASSQLMGTVLSIVLYFSAVIFVVGLLRRIVRYASIPAPLKIPTTPAPTTRRGVALRLAREVVLFESLFKASKWTWLFGWLFHFGLLLSLLAHLRFFVDPVWWWVAFVSRFSPYAGMLMFLGLSGLLLRRFLVDRVRYISAPSDFLMLLFLMAIAGTGLLMRYGFRADIVELKVFAMGLKYFDFASLAFHPVLLLHLLLVAVLLLIFPFSKLLHVPGLFFSPSRYQVDNPREKRHLSRRSNDGVRTQGVEHPERDSA